MVISGYADELIARLNGEARQQVAEIRQAASLAAATTAQLLALSRHGGEGFEVFNLQEAIPGCATPDRSDLGSRRHSGHPLRLSRRLYSQRSQSTPPVIPQPRNI
ncbi:MAG: hypothetical protein WDO73_30665 [Ignavibacteriota bacterium]